MLNMTQNRDSISFLYFKREKTTVMKDAADCSLLLLEPSAWFLVCFSFFSWSLF